MKIITVNLPETTITEMARITDEYELYPSRSELIRVAVREFLLRELGNIKKYQEYAEQEYQPLLRRPGNLDMRTVRFIRNLNSE